ncbi:MAG: hypothetical protein B7Z66_09930 [Chromatiales bacterium 21-64-14]|nr:MAG: hypothetical protein B7Z66_09930 [Chromatiales bacterium 21-64-14]HQU16224.1 hypothetical protein [Gammaproteobacteria bacterium]
MNDYLKLLAQRSRTDAPEMSSEVTEALAQLDQELATLTAQLEVEHYGPAVGLDGASEAYRLVVRCHEWQPNRPTWSLKVCDATPNCQWRATWTVQGVGRRRRARILQALPAFLSDYVQVLAAANKTERPAAQRIQEMARILSAPAAPVGHQDR